MDDLWPVEIGSVLLKSPKTFLEEQGKIIFNRSKETISTSFRVLSSNIIEKRIDEAFSGAINPLFYYKYIVKADKIDYETELLTIAYPIDVYPCIIVYRNAEDGLSELLTKSAIPFELKDTTMYIFSDTFESFKKCVSIIFSLPETIKTMNSLIALSI